MKTRITALLAVAMLLQACKKDAVQYAKPQLDKRTSWTPGQPLVNGAYTIININSGKSLDVINGSSANGALLQQWGYISPNLIFPNAQKWSITSLGSGYYKVINLNSNKAVDVPNGATTNGLQLQQWDYIGFNSQIWKIENVGFDLYKFTNKASGKVMTVKNGSAANGAQVVQYPDSANHQSQWFQIRQVAYKDIAVTNFFKRQTGIVTMDGGNSIPLSDGRVFWDFGDSGTGPYDPATGTLPCNGGVVWGNTGLLQPANNWNWSQSTSLIGPNSKEYFNSAPADQSYDYPGGGFQINDTVYVMYGHSGTTPAQMLGKLKFPAMNVVGFKVIQNKPAGITFGPLIKASDGYIYAYGAGNWIPPYNITQNIYVARFPQSNPNAAWNWWNGSAWVSNSAQIAPIASTAGGNQLSVCKVSNKYVIVGTDFSAGCDQGTGIEVATSSNPTGPFTAYKSVYNIDDRKSGHTPFFYGAIAHPEYINSNNELLITYCINHYGTCLSSCVSGRTDPDEYRVKGVRVPLSMIDASFN